MQQGPLVKHIDWQELLHVRRVPVVLEVLHPAGTVNDLVWFDGTEFKPRRFASR